MSDGRKLSRYFDKSASRVHDACTQFEQQYARPAYDNMKIYFRERPITSTFVTIFTLLSLVPIAFFTGTAVFVFVTFTLAALFVATLAAFTVILLCFGFLFFVLLGTFFISIFLTGAALSSYSLLRLALHVQREGPSTGISEWRREAKHSFLIARQPEDKAEQTKGEHVPTEERRANGFSGEEEKNKPKISDSESDKESEVTLRKEESEGEENVRGKEDEKVVREYARYGDYDVELHQERR